MACGWLEDSRELAREYVFLTYYNMADGKVKRMTAVYGKLPGRDKPKTVIRTF